MDNTVPAPSGPLTPGVLRADADAGAIPLPRARQGERTAALTGGVALTTVDKLIQWGRYSSLFPALFGLA